MSNFQQKAIHPETGEIELADWLDDFYGPHKYAVRFPDGQLYPERFVYLPDEKEDNATS